ncbi:MAG: BRcat domain-containing protein [Gemmataceae bacterium]|jgi:hypothetical protein
MATDFSCPNPSCKQLIRLESINDSPSITCPKCKKTITLRKSPKNFAPPQKNSTPLSAMPKETQDFTFESKSEIKSNFRAEKKPTSKQKKSNGLTLTQVFVLGFGMFFISVSGSAFYFIGLPLLKKEIDIHEKTINEANKELIDADFFILKPLDNYSKDQKLAQSLQTKFAYSGREKDIWLFYYKDFKTRNPTDSEIHQEMISRLKTYMPKNLEWEEKAENLVIEKISFKKFSFEGTREDSTVWVGDCHTSQVNGVLFLIICIAPIDKKELVLENWDKFNQGLTIKPNAKPDWKPTPRKAKLVAVDKVKLSFAAPEAIWGSQDTKDYDTNPDAVMIGKNPNDTGNFLNQKAKLQVFSSAKSTKDDKAFDMPEEKIFELLKEEKSAETKIEKLTDIKRTSVDLKNLTIKTEYFVIKTDDQIQKMIFWSKCSSESGALIFLCEIPVKAKDFWLDELDEILKSVSITTE